jgi:hypothetical protein
MNGKLLRVTVNANLDFEIQEIYQFGAQIQDLHMSDDDNLLFIRRRNHENYEIFDLNHLSLRRSQIQGTIHHIYEAEKCVIVEVDNCLKK